MSTGPEPYVSFLKRLPITLLTAMLLWLLLLRPVLDIAVPKFAESLIRAFEYPRVTRLITVEHQVQIRRSDFRSGSAIPTVPLAEIHFNTIILLALFMAVSKPFSRTQLERLFMGWSILFGIQSLNLYFHVKCVYALGLGEWSVQNYGDFARNLYGFLRYFSDLPGRFSAPFLIWLGFNWDVVTELIGIQSETRSTSKKRRKK
jgi:hypothetical protein